MTAWRNDLLIRMWEATQARRERDEALSRIPSEAAVGAVRELLADSGIRTEYRNDGPNVWLCVSCYAEVPQWDRKSQRNIPCPDPFPHANDCAAATLLREWPAVAEWREVVGQ